MSTTTNVKSKYIDPVTHEVLTPEEYRTRQKAKIKKKLGKVGVGIGLFVIVFGICFIILYPLFVKFSVAIRSQADLYDTTVIYIPKHLSLETFKSIWDLVLKDQVVTMENNIIVNTVWTSLLAAVTQTIACTLVGYGFARFKFPGKNVVFALVILCLVVPPQTIQLTYSLHMQNFDFFGIVNYLFCTRVNLLDSALPFALIGLTAQGYKNGLYIYMIRQNFRNLPKELEEAAYVDGAGNLRTFVQVMLPSAVSILVSIFLFAFVWQWTDTYYSGVFLENTKVMSKVLNSLAQTYWVAFKSALEQGNIPNALASQINNIGSILVAAPLLVLYIFTQRFFVESVERSGIVG